MASASKDFDESESIDLPTVENSSGTDFHALLTLMHDSDRRETLLRSTREERVKLKSEVEKLRLEKEWCVNDQGERTVPTPHEQALKICQQIKLDPDLLKDVLIALRIKKLDLQSNINKLRAKCDALSEKTS